MIPLIRSTDTIYPLTSFVLNSFLDASRIKSKMAEDSPNTASFKVFAQTLGEAHKTYAELRANKAAAERKAKADKEEKDRQHELALAREKSKRDIAIEKERTAQSAFKVRQEEAVAERKKTQSYNSTRFA